MEGAQSKGGPEGQVKFNFVAILREMIEIDSRYTVESVSAGQEVDNWIFSISREAPRGGGQHHTGRMMVAFLVLIMTSLSSGGDIEAAIGDDLAVDDLEAGDDLIVESSFVIRV